MAEEQKPVEVPKETAPAVEPVVEAAPAETTEAAAPVAATEAPATTETAAEPAAAATEETPAAAAEETKKEEVTPVEEGQLEHKGLNFPKNFIYSKQFFWFGSDAVESKSLSHYRRGEKSVEVGRQNTAWASHTGKGLLFFGDKSAPVGIINLADANEPTTDGPTKFFFTSNGHKHTFKAANVADRDNWVSQLKLKIAEAKELAPSVRESEAYKATIETFKPTVPAKKEEPKKEEAKKEETAEAPKEEAAVATETPAAEAPAADAAATEEVAKEEPKKEEPKRRSASRKRASFFGGLLGKKEESKKEEKKDDKAAETAAAEAPAAEAPAAEVETTDAPATDAPAAEAPVEAATETPAETKDTPQPAAPVKRNSIFGVFGKKEKKTVEAEVPAPAKEGETAAAAETAPVIPPVETSTPLAVEVASPATVPAETKEVTPATNGESKKEVKAEKRKSSLPFAFGKKDKSPVTSDEEAEKPEKASPFSKLRATIKGRGKSPQPAEKLEKTEEKAAEDKKAEDKPAEETTAEAPAPAEDAKPAEEPANKPEPVAAPAPAVTAAA